MSLPVPLRVVHVEDSPGDSDLMRRVMQDAGVEVQWLRVETERDYLAQLDLQPDVVVADYHVPGFGCLQALEILHARGMDIPFIVASGTIAQEDAVAIIRLGADDYVLKDRLARLPVAVTNAVSAARERAERHKADERIRRLNRVYAMLSGINAAIVRTREEPELLHKACAVAVEAGHFVMAWIGFIDRESRAIKRAAACGVEVDDFLAQAGNALKYEQPGPGLARMAIRTGRPQVSNDVAADARVALRSELGGRGIRSIAMLPLMRGGEAAGVLALYSPEAGFFDEDELRLLAELTSDIAFALDHIEKAHRANYLAYYDPLTGTPNRTFFHERLKAQLEDAAREGRKVALQVVDIERFKTINDTLGRHAGDELLVEVARRMEQGSLSKTWFARLEADHFAIVVPNLASASEVARRVEQRRAEVFGVPFSLSGTNLRVSARNGIAIFPDDASDAEALLRNAEAALKKAKAIGERYVFYTQEMTARIAEKLALENRLREAVERDEFVLHYQPKYDASGQVIAGLEALIRWRSPELGLVPPGDFVPLLEETGLILEVGAWALRNAALDHRRWMSSGLKVPKVAVNVSAIQLRQRDFVASVETALAIAGLSPECLELEITETLVMEDIEASIEKLAAVRRLGCSVSIDDFGTGYSSLFYLARLPMQSLKIDRSFVATMLDDATTMTVVQALISLAQSLRLQVVAEGVESEEQARMLRILRCDQLQGYFLSRPVDWEAMARLLPRRDL